MEDSARRLKERRAARPAPDRVLYDGSACAGLHEVLAQVDIPALFGRTNAAGLADPRPHPRDAVGVRLLDEADGSVAISFEGAVTGYERFPLIPELREDLLSASRAGDLWAVSVGARGGHDSCDVRVGDLGAALLAAEGAIRSARLAGRPVELEATSEAGEVAAVRLLALRLSGVDVAGLDGRHDAVVFVPVPDGRAGLPDPLVLSADVLDVRPGSTGLALTLREGRDRRGTVALPAPLVAELVAMPTHRPALALRLPEPIGFPPPRIPHAAEVAVFEACGADGRVTLDLAPGHRASLAADPVRSAALRAVRLASAPPGGNAPAPLDGAGPLVLDARALMCSLSTPEGRSALGDVVASALAPPGAPPTLGLWVRRRDLTPGADTPVGRLVRATTPAVRQPVYDGTRPTGAVARGAHGVSLLRDGFGAGSGPRRLHLDGPLALGLVSRAPDAASLKATLDGNDARAPDRVPGRARAVPRAVDGREL